jgi:1,4-dihydroxy-2-naphthoate octaprenyltransferase
MSVNILVTNNYRDYEQDKVVGKRTSIVLLGRRFGRIFYLVNGLLALLGGLPLFVKTVWWVDVLGLAFLVLFLLTWRELCRCQGRALNHTLAHTARNVFLFTLLLILALLMG